MDSAPSMVPCEFPLLCDRLEVVEVFAVEVPLEVCVFPPGAADVTCCAFFNAFQNPRFASCATRGYFISATVVHALPPALPHVHQSEDQRTIRGNSFPLPLFILLAISTDGSNLSQPNHESRRRHCQQNV